MIQPFLRKKKAFLLAAAHRHTVFNYENIAEYYANASPEMQRLMDSQPCYHRH